MAWTRITIEDAAKQLGMSQQAVRVQIQRGMLPIGKIFCGSKKNARHTYFIYQELLDEHILNLGKR